MPVKGCKFWPMLGTYGHEGSLACQTYCDTGHPFMIIISEDPWQWHLMPSFWQWRCLYMFERLLRLAFDHPTFRLRANAQTHCAIAAAPMNTIRRDVKCIQTFIMIKRLIKWDTHQYAIIDVWTKISLIIYSEHLNSVVNKVIYFIFFLFWKVLHGF